MAGSKPDYIVYTVRNFEGDTGEQKARWLEIGAAWASKEGSSINVTLEAAPISGRFVLVKPKPERAEG